jgi:hypothetical protein
VQQGYQFDWVIIYKLSWNSGRKRGEKKNKSDGPNFDSIICECKYWRNNQSKIWWHIGKDNKSTGKFHYNFILNKLIDKYNEEFKEI